MSLLDSAVNTIKNPIEGLVTSLSKVFTPDKGVELRKPDFTEGFQIYELVNGTSYLNTNGFGAVLAGDMLPHIPFSFGGEQKIIKEFYAGNPEPVVQLLGARETDLTIKGKFKAKRYTNQDYRNVPSQLQGLLDNIRIRGNLLHLVLGEWNRWGFLEKTDFKLNTLADIEYELTFSIVGFKQPTNGKFNDNVLKLPFDINSDLLKAAALFKKPDNTFPKSLADEINDMIGKVGAAINVLTGFVDGTLKTAEDINKSINRAIGLVKNARASVSVFQRRMRALSLTVTSLAFSLASSAAATRLGNLSQSSQNALAKANSINNAAYITRSLAVSRNMQLVLGKFLSQFEALSRTVPQARYLVKSGDTLQKVSIKFYNSADQWKKIYDHNKLTTTVLSPGKVLEIPK